MPSQHPARTPRRTRQRAAYLIPSLRTHPQAKEVGSEEASRARTSRRLDPVNLRLGAWTGTQLVDVERVLERSVGSDLKGLLMESSFLARLKLNYVERGRRGVFRDVPAFLRYCGRQDAPSAASAAHANARCGCFVCACEPLRHGGLDEFTSVSATDFYRRSALPPLPTSLAGPPAPDGCGAQCLNV